MTDEQKRQEALEAAHHALAALDIHVIEIGETGKYLCKVTQPAAESLADLLLAWKHRGLVEGRYEAADVKDLCGKPRDYDPVTYADALEAEGKEPNK